MSEPVKRWVVGAIAAAVFAFLGWQAATLLKHREPLPPQLASAQPKAQNPPSKAPSRKAPKVVRDISRPQPIEIPVATLPLFRSGAQQTRMASGRTRPTELSAWIMGLTLDTQSNLWIATEDAGVWRCPLGAGSNATATVFTTEDGLGDNHIYAIACDRQGRIWVGHLNHGVSVWNGAQWRNYDVLDGPLGERVFRIKVNPVDGDVWIATSRGLSRYSVKEDRWMYYTRAEGLPSNQIQAMAFDRDGTIYAGTQCDGVAICTPEKIEPRMDTNEHESEGRLEYRDWRVVHGAEKLPLVARGSGLPTDLINDVLVSRNGTVWVATTTGLAWSRDKGQTWRFVRGQDWVAKVQGLYGGPPAGWQPTGGAVLAEDYVECLAEDPESGKLWVGYREKGCGVLDALDMVYASEVSGVYARAILPVAGGTALVGTYADGLVDAKANRAVSYRASSEKPKAAAFAGLPLPAGPPTLAELNAMWKELSAIPAIPEAEQPKVVALDDDWRTQGDWLGRYGRYWACLAGLAGSDYLWGAGRERLVYRARVGPNHPQPEVLRRWIQWLRGDEARFLELPSVYLQEQIIHGAQTAERPRRAAHWDDHGEAYSMTLDGPHVYCTLKIPAGRFCLAVYNANYNGHGRRERYRDYRVSIRSGGQGWETGDAEDFQRLPVLAYGRIRDFHNGVWKRFLVNGPTDLTIEVNRNYSFNSTVAAVMIDLVDQDPPPYFQTEKSEAELLRVSQRGSGTVSPSDSSFSGSEGLVDRLLEVLSQMQLKNPKRWSDAGSKCYVSLSRWYLYKQGRADRNSWLLRLGTCYYQTAQYAKWEECQQLRGLTTARQIEKSLQWDGAPVCSGKGNQFVRAYLANRQTN